MDVRLHEIEEWTSAGLIVVFGGALFVLCADSALYLRSVYRITNDFRGLRCHPPICKLLKLRLSDDSSPASGAISFNKLERALEKVTGGSCADISW